MRALTKWFTAVWTATAVGLAGMAVMGKVDETAGAIGLAVVSIGAIVVIEMQRRYLPKDGS